MRRQKYIQQIDLLDQELSELVLQLETYSEDQLAIKPAANVWSPRQLLIHMRLSEALSLGYVKKKLSFDPSLADAGLMSFFRLMSVGFLLWAPVKIKSPPGVGGAVLEEDITCEAVIQEWRSNRADLRGYVEALDEKWLRKEVYRHPYAGRMHLGHMLAFFRQHNAHHRKQLKERLPK